MSTVGIITEYNPFHFGHLYHLNKSKEYSQANTVICIMNGNFVQRGEPALLDKWARTKMALANGVDMVIELPLVYGIRSAEYFAKGAISLLEKSNIVDNIVFGSEVGNITPLKEIASLLSNENEYFQKNLQKKLSNGYSFPKARELAIRDYLSLYPDLISIDNNEITNTIAEPNNILGIEYLKALQNLNSGITPYTIKRKGSNYHKKGLDHDISSATAIREIIYKNKSDKDNLAKIKKYIPENSYKILKEEINKGKTPLKLKNLEIMIISALRKQNTKTLLEFAEINNGLENRIYTITHQTADLLDLITKIKTKAFTWTRIQRNLLHIFLNLKENDFKIIDKNSPQYIRVLGIKKERTELLSNLSKNTDLKVIINPSDYLKEIDIESQDPLIKSLSYDIMASDIYSLLYNNPTYRQGHLDFTTPLIKL